LNQQEISYLKALRPVRLRDGLIPLVFIQALALIAGAWILETPWAAEHPGPADVLFVLLGGAGFWLGLIFLRVYQPLAIPVLTGNWRSMAAMADALGLHMGAIDTRRGTFLANEHLLKATRLAMTGMATVFEESNDSRGPCIRGVKLPLDSLRRVAAQGGLSVGRFSWRDAETLLTTTLNATTSTTPGVIAVMGLDVSELDLLRSHFRQFQRRQALENLLVGFAHDAKNLTFAGRAATSALAQSDESVSARETEALLYGVFDGLDQTLDRLAAWGGEAELKPRLLEMGDFLRNQEPLLRYLLSGDLQLEITVPDEEIWVRLNGSDLSHALLNLVSNSREAIYRAGHDRGEIQLELAVIQSESRVELRVRDSGPGVAEEERIRIFVPWVTSKASKAGHGLGLALAKRFANDAGGALYYEPSASGACFVFTFPIQTPGHGGRGSKTS